MICQTKLTSNFLLFVFCNIHTPFYLIIVTSRNSLPNFEHVASYQ